MNTVVPPLAVLLDCALGDPRWMPHPVRGIGRLATFTEKLARGSLGDRVGSGLLATLLVLVAVGLIAFTLVLVASWHGSKVEGVVGAILIWTTIAPRDLYAHSEAVRRALADGDLEDARRKVGRIVGRDTDELSEAEVVRAAVESVAESTLDAMVAPLFYAALTDPVGAMLYRAVNTLDSMWGYRNDRYLTFGRFAARLDDVLNYVPARINAVVLCVAAAIVTGRGRSAWRILRRDGRNHTSPKAGLSEAAVAGALDVRLGGTNSYFGKPSYKLTIGDDVVPLVAEHIRVANRMMFWTTGLLTAAISIAPFISEQ